MKFKFKISKNKNNLIKPIILLGIFVFIICAVTCVFHISSIRSSLEEEVNQQLIAQLEVAGEVLEANLQGTEGIIAAAADEMGTKREQYITETHIYRILNHYKFIDDFQWVMYLTEESRLYLNDGRNIDSSDLIKEGLEDINESRIYVVNDFWRKGRDWQLLFIAPVNVNGERQGFMIGLKDCKNILDSDTFSYLKQMGDVMVINEKGAILDCNFVNISDQDEKYETVYDCMEKYWRIDGQKIRRFKEKVIDESTTEAAFPCTNSNGDRYFYSFYTTEGFLKLRIVCMYTDSIYSDMEDTVVVGSIATCLIMMLSMAFLVFVAYRHNSSANKLISRLAYEDEVTGGKNLNYFREFVGGTMEKYEGMPFVIHRFDISNFRYINEAYGHIRADKLLKAIIEEADAIFYSKELCIRMNADQFALFTRNTQDLEDRFFVFSDKVNARALDIGIRYPIKFKRGVYQVRNREEDISLMIDKANMARKMLIAEEKENVSYYSDRLADDLKKTDKIESEMETALFNREFKMYVQPKWDIKEDRLYGGEALVRWMKDDGNMIYPSDFVPVFEKNGFIEQLDIFMLESACKLIREQLDSGQPIYPISVNQSRMLLNDPDYINRITAMLDKYQVPKGYIELEITESMLFSERDKMISILNELKEMELQLSMDDFGSGYSSLNLLKDFPFDVLKIDKEFFSEATTSESSVWILRMIIEMAEGLGIRVICEGVETQEQIEMLRRIGCRYVQGYYYSKPIPVERFVEQYCRESA